MSTNKKDYSYLDTMALEPTKWEGLSDQEFQMMTFRHCLLYGISQNRKMIPTLFQLYDSMTQRSSDDQRVKMLTALASTIRKQNKRAIMALMPFIQVEENGQVIRTASHFFVNLSFLSNKEFHSGAQILIELIKNQPEATQNAHIILGLLDQDNEKIKKMILPLQPLLSSEIKSILWNNGVDFM